MNISLIRPSLRKTREDILFEICRNIIGEENEISVSLFNLVFKYFNEDIYKHKYFNTCCLDKSTENLSIETLCRFIKSLEEFDPSFLDNLLKLYRKFIFDFRNNPLSYVLYYIRKLRNSVFRVTGNSYDIRTDLGHNITLVGLENQIDIDLYEKGVFLKLTKNGYLQKL